MTSTALVQHSDGVNTMIVFFCFFTSNPSPNSELGASHDGKKAAGLDGTAGRDGDTPLGSTRRRAVALDLLDEIHALNNLACAHNQDLPNY